MIELLLRQQWQELLRIANNVGSMAHGQRCAFWQYYSITILEWVE